jgi:hypothetical protein
MTFSFAQLVISFAFENLYPLAQVILSFELLSIFVFEKCVSIFSAA